jgi:hypothetical protein
LIRELMGTLVSSPQYQKKEHPNAASGLRFLL